MAIFAACLPAGRVVLARRRVRSTTGGSSSRGHSSFSRKMGRSKQERLPEHENSPDGLVVFKTTSFGVESTAELTGGQAGSGGRFWHGKRAPPEHEPVELGPV